MGLISQIKADVAKSGQSKKDILYVRSDAKVRVRFLQELDDGYSFVFHDNFNEGINCFCPKNIDEDNECIYCDSDANVRTRNMYAWSVYNYDTKQVEIALFAVNRVSPVNQLITMSESYGTITDRDYVIGKTGKSFDTVYSVIPQDKEKFRNPKAKPFSKSAIEKILMNAFPYEGDNSSVEEEDEEEEVKSKKKASKPAKEYAKMPEDEDEVPWKEEESKPKKSAKKAKSDKPTEEWVEDLFDENDIDEDDFLEYNELESIDDLLEMSKVEIKKLVSEYVEEDDEE